MTLPSDPKSAAKPTPVQLAERALAMKREAAKAGGPQAAAGRKQSLTAAAHRSASQSKPAMRK